jgi:CBS domain containing-hemolysin-like protein
MAHGHSRYPVLTEDTQDVVGVVHLADLLTTAEPDTATTSPSSPTRNEIAGVVALSDVLRRLFPQVANTAA